MKSSYLTPLFVIVAGAAATLLSCAQSETLDPPPSAGAGGRGNTATGGSGTGGAGNSAATFDGGSGVDSGGGPPSGTGGTGPVPTGGTSPGTGAGGKTGAGGHPGAGGSGTAGRAGSGGSGGTAATFAEVTALFAANCVACHDGTNHTDLRAAGLYARIVNQSPTVSTVSACKSQELIVPDSPAMSLISNKIKGTNLGGCGNRMPNGCSTTSTNPRACLTTAQIATVDSWINAGAPM